MSKDINDAAKPLRDNWELIKNEYFKSVPGFYLELTTVFRSPNEQFELFKKGRTMDTQGNWITTDKSQIVTNVDGYKIMGAHNYYPARAIDVAVVSNKTGKITWEESYYTPLIKIANEFGLESGGEWKSIKDYPHLQIRDYKNYA